MNNSRIRSSIAQNVNLWIALWILILLNVFMVAFLTCGFSIMAVLAISISAMAGTGILKYMAENGSDTVKEISEIHEDDARNLMKEVRPLCDDIFTREIKRMIEPVAEEYKKDITQGLEWLWEDLDEFIEQVENSTDATHSVLQMMSNLSDEKYKIVRHLEDNIGQLTSLLEQNRKNKEIDYQDLEKCLSNRSDRLMREMEKEKDIFYEYIFKLLVERLRDSDEDEDITEYFNVYKLGEQFTAVMGKSLDMRLSSFQDSLINELENLSADIVGRMQKSTLQLANTFNQMEQMMEQLSNECRGESGVLLRRMDEVRNKVAGLKEQANEKLLTLAWQDILVEKRWQDIKEKLYMIRDQVMDNVGEDVIEYIKGFLTQEIPGFESTSSIRENAVLVKALIDAEAIYRVYTGNNLPDIIDNGVYSLLQFVRPVELLILKNIRFSEEGIRERNMVKERIKTGELQDIFIRVQQEVANYNKFLAEYLEDTFPRAFQAFCNNPYIKQKTDNLNQAAWMVFMALIEDPTIGDEFYCLAGLLITIHKLRTNHIQPLKSLPIPLDNDDEIEHMRSASFKAVSILLNAELKGIVKIGRPSPT